MKRQIQRLRALGALSPLTWESTPTKWTSHLELRTNSQSELITEPNREIESHRTYLCARATRSPTVLRADSICKTIRAKPTRMLYTESRNETVACAKRTNSAVIRSDILVPTLTPSRSSSCSSVFECSCVWGTHTHHHTIEPLVVTPSQRHTFARST